MWQEFLELTGEEQDRIIFTEELSGNQEVSSKAPKTASIRATAGKEIEVKGMSSSDKKNESFVAAKEISYMLKRHNPPLVSCVYRVMRI